MDDQWRGPRSLPARGGELDRGSVLAHKSSAGPQPMEALFPVLKPSRREAVGYKAKAP